MTPTICAPSSKAATSGNSEYIGMITAAGVMGGVIWGMRKRFSFGKTAAYALVLGIAANYVGTIIINKITNNDNG